MAPVRRIAAIGRLSPSIFAKRDPSPDDRADRIKTTVDDTVFGATGGANSRLGAFRLSCAGFACTHDGDLVAVLIDTALCSWSATARAVAPRSC
ncbi:hypothetical protein AB0I53_15945 [Saccharopolyspora sp. NPDC050389]|uniref:hypothetical protein n=1 Tax=Saccharopolyspora sp. NPDC050389 TaxID=3155516 RepID=UPI0033C138C0